MKRSDTYSNLSVTMSNAAIAMSNAALFLALMIYGYFPGSHLKKENTKENGPTDTGRNLNRTYIRRSENVQDVQSRSVP